MKKTPKAKRSSAATRKPATRAAAAVELERRVSGLDWKDLAAGLGGATRGAGGIPERDLREYFGAEEFERLQQLAGFSKTVRSRSAPRGKSCSCMASPAPTSRRSIAPESKMTSG